MKQTIFYFAYGSNMSLKRLLARVPSAEKIDVGWLESHTLKFHKVGLTDDSAKCDIQHTAKPGDYVYGVVYRITSEEMPALDRYEGLGRGYEQKIVPIQLQNQTSVDAFTYYATHINASLKPFDWYREHVVRGAREHALPDNYIRQINAIDCMIDSDRQRYAREMAIYS